MHDRLLHLIVTHVLAPFGTQYAIIRKQDYWWIHMIKKKHCPNLPAFIFSDMMKVVQHRESTLVYGMVLSVVFRHLGIDIIVTHLSYSTIALIWMSTLWGVWVM